MRGPAGSGLVITLASWVGLVVIALISRRSGGVFESALTDGLGLGPSDPRDRQVEPGRLPVPAARPSRRAHQEPRVRPVRQAQPARHLPGPRSGHRHGSPAPVLFQIHGGGWVIGDKSQQGLPLMLQLAADGWVCVAINYRLSPKATWPEHLVDCKRALAWVREHIAEYGGDPEHDLRHRRVRRRSPRGDGRDSPPTSRGTSRSSSRPTRRSPRACRSTASTTSSRCSPASGRRTALARLLARWVMKATPEEDPEAFADASPVQPRPRRRSALLRDPRHPRQPRTRRPGPGVRRAAPRESRTSRSSTPRFRARHTRSTCSTPPARRTRSARSTAFSRGSWAGRAQRRPTRTPEDVGLAPALEPVPGTDR